MIDFEENAPEDEEQKDTEEEDDNNGVVGYVPGKGGKDEEEPEEGKEESSQESSSSEASPEDEASSAEDAAASGGSGGGGLLGGGPGGAPSAPGLPGAPVGASGALPGGAPVAVPGGEPSGESAPEGEEGGEPAQMQLPVVVPVNQELKDEDQGFQHDLDMGHIKPETYKSLFAKKDTMGKIGTLFGLLISGAGSGLTGQPNALLGMMQKEIDNDLDAQKASHVNAQNLYRLNQQNLLNKAQVGLTQAQTGRVGKENEMTEAQIEKIGHENRLTETQIANLKKSAGLTEVETNIKADALSRMQANRILLHDLTQKVNSLPVGSQARLNAEQQLALLNKTVQTENYSLADRAEAASALSKAFTPQGNGNGAPNSEAKFQQDQQTLRLSGNEALADDKAARHFPGIDGLSSIPLTGGDREEINSGITFQNQLRRFTDWTKSHSGDLSPSEKKYGEALAAQLQGAYRQATHGGVYKEGEQGFISSVIDSTPTKFFNSIRVLPKLQAVQQESHAQLNQVLKSKGFQGGYNPQGGASAPAGETKVVGGVTYQKVPGGWQKVK